MEEEKEETFAKPTVTITVENDDDVDMSEKSPRLKPKSNIKKKKVHFAKRPQKKY